MLTDSDSESDGCNYDGSSTRKGKKFPYPKCWGNDERMNVLMSPYRPRSVNPENYDAKISFWQEMIKRHCEHKGCPYFNKKEVQMAFKRKGRVPYDLETVLNDMIAKSQIRLRSEFMYDPLNSWTGWAINSFMKKPFSWGSKKIFPKIDGDPDYIHLDLVKEMTKNLYSVLKEHAGKLIQYDELKKSLLGNIKLSAEGLDICLHNLHSQRKIYVEYVTEDNERKIDLIKIPGKSDSTEQITETDRAIFNLQRTQSNLLKQIETIEADIKINDGLTRQYIRDGKKQIAKTYLRKKHLLEKNHEKRSIALHNIDTMLATVEETRSNGEIVDAYKFGSKALQTLLSDADLKYDNVDQIATDVREAVETHNEIQETLATVNANVDNNLDDEELENELREILGENDGTTTTTAQANIKNNNIVVNAVEMDDKELLELLEGLDVEQNSPQKEEISNKLPTPRI